MGPHRWDRIGRVKDLFTARGVTYWTVRPPYPASRNTINRSPNPLEWKFTRRDLDRLVARWAASEPEELAVAA